MNFQAILNDIAKADPEVFERLSPRRKVLRDFGKKVAFAALPFAIGSLFTKAYGKTTDVVIDTLNFALKLEYLENDFYHMAINASNLIPAGDQLNAINIIAQHEAAHVAFLKSAISGAGGTPISEPAFDFTAKGTFADVFSNYGTFLAVAQTFEDTGVRAYKGAAPSLMGSGDVLTKALQIHSVEARHASKLRQMRAAYGTGVVGNLKPWITGNSSNINSAAVQGTYNGEDLASQAGVSIVNIGGSTVSSNAATEAFDEPLDAPSVTTIVTPFFA